MFLAQRQAVLDEEGHEVQGPRLAVASGMSVAGLCITVYRNFHQDRLQTVADRRGGLFVSWATQVNLN